MKVKPISPHMSDYISRARVSRNAKTSDGRQGDHVKFEDIFIAILVSILSRTKRTKKEKKP